MADSIEDDKNDEINKDDPEGFDETDGEALLLSVFELCSVNENNCVKVSKLIDHLLREAAADENPKVLGYLDELAVILDPSGTDISINKEMYSQGIRDWIQTVQARRSYHNFDESDVKPSLNGSTDPVFVYRGKGENDRSLPLVNGHGERSLEDQSFISSEPSSEWEKSQSEILGRIQELQIANKKLLDEKSKLRSQVDNTEESNSALLSEIKKMRNKLSKYEQLLDKNKSLEKDNESLKNVVNEYLSSKEELIARTSQLEKENTALQFMVDDYQRSEMAKNSALETVREENRDLLKRLNEQKQLYSDLEVLQDLKQKIVDESSSKSEYMTSFIAELSMANEALKAEKNRLEVDLLESKHEISKLAAMQTPSSAISRQPMYSSTPFHRMAPVNLQQEIDSELASGNLSSSSRDRSGFKSRDTSDRSSKAGNESGRSDTSASTAASTDKYTSVAQQIALSFKRKKDLALKQIAELAAFDASPDVVQNSKVLIKNYEEGLDTFANEVEGLATAKQLAENRSARLMESLELAKAENKRLAENQEKALLKIGDISMTSAEMEHRIEELLKEIDQERQRVKDLSSENEKFESLLKTEKTKNNELREEIEDLKRKQASFDKESKNTSSCGDDQQVQELISLVKELEDRVLEYTRKLFDLEEVVEGKDYTISEKSKEIQRLETVCSEITTQHESDLKQIFDMFSVPADSPQKTKVEETLSIELLKDRFESFMSTLKSKIQNMGIRDGPIGSEGTEAKEESSHSISQRHFIDQHVAVGRKIHMDSDMNIGVVSLSSISCQTDIGMVEITEAIHAVTMLKALQQRETDTNYFDEELNGIEESSSVYMDAEGNVNYSDGLQKGLVEVENIYSSSVENVLESDPLVSSELNSNTTPGLIAYSNNVDQCSDKDCKGMGGFDEIIHEKTEESTDPRIIEENARTQNQSPPGYLSSSPAEPPKERRVTRRFFRSVSVSTDESNTSDEMGDIATVEVENERKESTKSEQSAVDSEVSVVSTASKKARRIGISAEPVRLPTWTELRESIKLNQQIYLEEEMTNDRLMRTPRNSIDVAYSSSLTQERASNESKDNKIDTLGGSNTGDTSMEWCYEFPTGQAIEDPAIIEAKEDGISFSAIESKNSVASSVHSVAGSNQTASSNVSNTANAREASAEEEEKGGEKRPEKDDSLGELKRRQLFRKNEENAIASIDQEEKKLEKRFNAVVLSFKTDQYTLQRRLEKQERARDVAESGMEREIRKLTEKLQTAQKLSFTRELKEILDSLTSHADILRKAGMKVSAQAEQHGCFQQESRISPVIETVISYAEHLRLSLERSREAEDTRNKEISHVNIHSTPVNEVNSNIPGSGHCKRCHELLKKEDDREIKANGALEEEKSQKDKVQSLTFFGLASSILRERKNLPKIYDHPENEDVVTFEEKERFDVKPDIVNYAPKDLTGDDDDKTITKFERPGRSLCNCMTMVFRFFVSVVMFSTILFLFANYVELDLTRMINNWNEQLVMYSKRFFDKDKESL